MYFHYFGTKLVILKSFWHLSSVTSLLLFFRELNGPQYPSSETCTQTWVLLAPAHRQGNERSGFNPATDAFGSLLSHAAGTTPYSCSASQAVTGVCTDPHPHAQGALQSQSPFSRKPGQYKDLPSLFLRDHLALKSRQVPEKHLHLISFYNVTAAEFCSTFKKTGI